jgi:hypothetical protein
VAGNHPIEFDREYMTAGYTSYTESNAGIFADAARESLKPDVIFLEYIGDRACILEKDKETPLLTDTHPRLEYYYFFPPSKRPIRCD